MRLLALLFLLALTACGTAAPLTPPAPTVARVADITRTEWERHTSEEHLNLVRYVMSGMHGCRATPEQITMGVEMAYRVNPGLQDLPLLITGSLAAQNGCMVPGQ